jgi:hypothetical protein
VLRIELRNEREAHLRSMGIFSPKRAPNAKDPAWTPTVDMAAARPTIFALANSPGGNDVENGAAIARFVQLSERPSTVQVIQLAAKAGNDRSRLIEQTLNRPWTWLAAVMRQAGTAGDHHLVLAGLWWACYWTSDLLPRNNNISALDELELCPIEPTLKAEILALGLASAGKLPENFVVAGDQTGQLLVGTLALAAPRLLGLESE